LTLLKKNRTIKGVVKLPDGKTASGNIEVEITAENDALDFAPQKTVTIGKENHLLNLRLQFRHLTAIA